MSEQLSCSILERARREGYNNGFSEAAAYGYEDAFASGRERALREAPRRLYWFAGGLITGVILAAWLI